MELLPRPDQLFETFQATGIENLKWAARSGIGPHAEFFHQKEDFDKEFSGGAQRVEMGENARSTFCNRHTLAGGIFWRTAYGRPVIGTNRMWSGFRWDNLRAFYHKFYQPR